MDGVMLDELLPDAIVHETVRRLLFDSGGIVSLESGEINVPLDGPHEIISKAMFEHRFNLGFAPLRVIVAVGGLREIESGIPIANICFFTLWFELSHELVTVDVEAELGIL